MKKYIVAYDIGGTNIRAVVFDPKLRILDKISEKTAKEHSAILKQVVRMMEELFSKNLLKKTDISAVGVSFAAGLKNGRAVNMPNLKLKRGIDPAKVFSKLFRLPVFVLNDVRAAALGELNFGLGRDKKNFIVITISTGIGSGIVVDGRLLMGSGGMAGEIDAIVIDYHHDPVTGVRGKGNFELLGSGTGLELAYSSVTGRRLNAHDIQVRAEKGEHAALKAFNASAEAIGFGLVTVTNLLNPELIILFGSHIVKGRNLLMPSVSKILKKYSLSVPRVVFSKNEDIALLGAAKYAKDKGRIL